MSLQNSFPLDLQKTGYSYLERPNVVLVSMLESQVLKHSPNARILDIGCGCGATATDVKTRYPNAHFTGVEPDLGASKLARVSMDEVFHGMLDAWLASNPQGKFDAVVLSDVIEHVVDPVAFLRQLVAHPSVQDAVFVISVPNLAVWYNRIRTLLGKFEYSWSGLFDRTHLRFYTRSSVRKVLEYVGLDVVEQRATASIVQSAAPVLRRLFDEKVEQGDHLALSESSAFKIYRRFVEPIETAACGLWPELLGFQIVSAGRIRSR